MRRLALTLAVLAGFVLLLERAAHYEDARAGAPPPSKVASSHEQRKSPSARTEAPTASYQGLSARAWAKRAVQQRKNSNARGRTIRRLRRELASREIGPTLAIRLVFGAHASAALRVAWCESRWYTGATNGQYLGLFQVSAHWRRSIPGFDSTALGQARHAYRVFAATGYSWSHWECRP